MERDERNDRFAAAEESFAGYTVYDRDGDKVGKVDDLFLDESDQPEYVGVKMGFFGLSSTLVPFDAVRADEGERALYVQAEKEQIKNGPRFDNDSEITPDFEQQVRGHYGLSSSEGERGSYGGYYGDDDSSTTGSSAAGATAGSASTRGDTDSGRTGSGERQGSDRGDEDELRVQRSEEELRAGVREREAGKLNVRKRVRTERERIAVPKKREEVSVERVAVNEEASPGQIGEDEISVPVVEEEVVVDKRAVVKEEIRVKKDVVQDEEIVEADVRKEEIDIDDSSGTTGRRDDRDV